MNALLAFWQASEAGSALPWNYVVLGVLIVLAVVLGISVMRKKSAH